MVARRSRLQHPSQNRVRRVSWRYSFRPAAKCERGKPCIALLVAAPLDSRGPRLGRAAGGLRAWAGRLLSCLHRGVRKAAGGPRARRRVVACAVAGRSIRAAADAHQWKWEVGSRRLTRSLGPYSFSHSSLETPACRRIRANNSRPISFWCGFGIVRLRSPFTMKGCFPPE